MSSLNFPFHLYLNKRKVVLRVAEAVHSDTAPIINIDNVSQKSTLIRNQGGKITLFKIVNTSWERESWERKERNVCEPFHGVTKNKKK